MTKRRKKLLIIIIACSFALLFALSFSIIAKSCQKEAIACPKIFTIDENNVLSWNEVDGARRYKIEIKNVETNEVKPDVKNKEEYSLNNLDEGYYEIRVKSIAGSSDNKDSGWSEIIEFHKGYETGAIMTLINNKTEYEITKMGSTSGDVVFMDDYRDKPITRVGVAAFRGSKIYSIVLGNYITEIQDNAFYNCRNLSSVTLPEKLETIGVNVFQSCYALKSIELPDSLTYISDNIFNNCRALTKVKIGNNVKTIGEWAFSDCVNLPEILIPDSVIEVGVSAFSGNAKLKTVYIGKNVKTINKNAFFMCEELENVEFVEKSEQKDEDGNPIYVPSTESSLEVLGEGVFRNCYKLARIVLPNKLQDIGTNCFYGSSAMEEIVIPDSVTHVGYQAFNGTKFYVNAYNEYQQAVENESPDVMSKGYIYADKWLVACLPIVKQNLEEITTETLKSDVVGIADSVFEGCEKLQYVTLPTSIRVIGQRAFGSCTALYEFETYDDTLEFIDREAFVYCEYLGKLLLGDGLKKIGSYAFAYCAGLYNPSSGLLIPDSVQEIGTYAFMGSGVETEANESGVIYAGNWVVACTNNTQTAVIKNSTIGIADYAFYQCNKVKSVVGLNYAKYIGRGAFYECEGLESVTLNLNLEKIADYTFYKCSSLSSITLPRNLKSIGRSAFYMSGLLQLNMSETKISTIDDYAFYMCSNLKKVTFSDGLTSIGNYAFYKTALGASLYEVDTLDPNYVLEIPNAVTTIGDRAFYANEKLINVKFGEKLESIGEAAFYRCVNLTSINLPASLNSIGGKAFYNCSEVLSVTLNEGLEVISDYAFFGITKPASLVLPTTVTSIGKYAFKGWNGLTSLVLSKNIKEIGAHAFYGCKNMTIYTDAESILGKWNVRFNSSYRPVIWGCTLSDDGSYVYSLKIDVETFLNTNAKGGITAPQREGYVFGGWSEEEGSDVRINYSILEAPIGKTLYVIWNPEESVIDVDLDC